MGLEGGNKMYKVNIVDESRIPLLKKYSKEELIGRRVRVVSNASYKHYKRYGRIIGFSKVGEYIQVYFNDTQCKANFCPGSLELIN